MSTIIRARAPLRLGLAGGGTDVSPYCDMYGGYVLNASLLQYAYATIKIVNDSFVHFISSDQRIEDSISTQEKIEIKNKLNLHKAVYAHFIEKYNNGNHVSMELSTYCDAPVGSGLGSSSTLVVAMVRAFVELFNLPFDDYKIAATAFQIERIDVGLQGGRQDQYAATFGGFNFMEFYENERAIINPLRIKSWILCELEASIVMYFTGVSRESAHIISDQSSNVTSGVMNAIEAMHGLKREALATKECLLRGDFSGLIESMKIGWENKKKSAKSVSNSKIDEIYESAIKAGALAGKVSGAGGGGFMWFFTPIVNRKKVMEKLFSFGGHVSNCHFSINGAEAWRIS